MDDKLPQYSGPLPPDKIAWGMSIASKNAMRLVLDAKLLLENERYPSAASIALLAIEEAGKLEILRRLSTAQNENEIKDCWKAYRSHTRKNAAGGIGYFVDPSKPIKLGDLAPMFVKGAKHTYELNNIKQLGFYTDCLGKANWSDPDDIIGKELATAFVTFAKILAAACMMTTPKEVELWQQHMTGVTDLSDQYAVLAGYKGFYEAMKEAGLPSHDYEDMRKFIVEGIGPT